jgi:DNA-binding NarL/FixJ family response regulator
MLECEPDLQVVGEASDGREAVALCREKQPDLVLMDVTMPGMNGLDATRAIKSSSHRTIVVIISMHDHPDYLLEAFNAGASGYVLKDSSQAEVVNSVRQALRGETLLNARVATQLLRSLAGRRDQRATGPVERLTAREREVLRPLAQGKTNREIAAQLMVSPYTVKVHVEHIIAKLGVCDRTQAAVRALELNLI